VNKQKSTVSTNKNGEWAAVLGDARIALRSANARVRKIKQSIKAIEEKIRTGEPFPDYAKTQSTQN